MEISEDGGKNTEVYSNNESELWSYFGEHESLDND